MIIGDDRVPATVSCPAVAQLVDLLQRRLLRGAVGVGVDQLGRERCAMLPVELPAAGFGDRERRKRPIVRPDSMTFRRRPATWSMSQLLACSVSASF